MSVDEKAECVLLPVRGSSVPINLSLIKNVGKPTVEGAYCVLRLNFVFPGTAAERELFPDVAGKGAFIKEMYFKSRDASSLDNIAVKIRETQKKLKQKADEDAQRKECVEQPQLVLSRDAQRPVIRDVNIKPNPSGGAKRVTGALEAHENGFRYTGTNRDKVDIIYTNIKHALFQECIPGQTGAVLVHFKLKEPVLLKSKKKTWDFQFYADIVRDDDLDQRERQRDDDAEIQAEQRERAFVDKMNGLFMKFTTDVEQKVWQKTMSEPLEWDIPWSQFRFSGCPDRVVCDLMPASRTLFAVHDSSKPFVLTLEDVEMVVFERIRLGSKLKNFDIAVVFKDYNRPVHMLTSVPNENLEDIQQWFTEVDILVYKSDTNMTWAPILKGVREDPQTFVEDGCWDAYFGEADADSEEDSEPESEYEESGSSEDSDDDSDDSDDESYASESDPDSDEDEEEEGLDWDELDKRAANDDRQKAAEDRDNDRKRAMQDPGGARKRAR